jgi:hypothetical protein
MLYCLGVTSPSPSQLQWESESSKVLYEPDPPPVCLMIRPEGILGPQRYQNTLEHFRVCKGSQSLLLQDAFGGDTLTSCDACSSLRRLFVTS